MKEVNTPGLELIGDDEVHGVNFEKNLIAHVQTIHRTPFD
jgi:hypothetical protein